MDQLDILKEFAKREIKTLDSILKNGFKRKEVFSLDCSDLIDYQSSDIRKSERFKTLFEIAAEMNGPVLYIFEVLSKHDSSEIVEAIRGYKSLPSAKATPAIKKKYPNSRVLYVGKVKKNFWGRLIQHLGYYDAKTTQGLQLHYWAPQLNLKLQLTAIEFEKESEEMLALIEKDFAHHLQPIAGWH